MYVCPCALLAHLDIAAGLFLFIKLYISDDTVLSITLGFEAPTYEEN